MHLRVTRVMVTAPTNRSCVSAGGFGVTDMHAAHIRGIDRRVVWHQVWTSGGNTTRGSRQSQLVVAEQFRIACVNLQPCVNLCTDAVC